MHTIRKGNYVRVIKSATFYREGWIGKVNCIDKDGDLWVDFPDRNDICIHKRNVVRHYVRG